MLKAIRTGAIRALATYPIAALGRGLLRGYASVFMLHRLRVRPADRYAYSVDSLRRFIPILRASGARFVSLGQLVREVRSGSDVSHSVAFTIDDGFADQAVLARELELAYGAIALVVNHAAGRGESRDGIHMADINATLTGAIARVRRILESLVQIDGDT